MCVTFPPYIIMVLSNQFTQQLAASPKPSGNGVMDIAIRRAKRLDLCIRDVSGAEDHADGMPRPPTAQESLPTVRAIKIGASLPCAGSQSSSRQPSSKGEEFVSKLTNYLEERSSLSSSSSSGLNAAFVLMTSQNNELRSQNTELRNQVDRYRTEVDRLEKKLEKARKKAEMADLVARLTNNSISPQPPSVSEITRCMLTLSTSERMPSPGSSPPQLLPPIHITGPVSHSLTPTMEGVVEGGTSQEGVVRFCPDGSEIWYPGNEMPGDYQLGALNSFWTPLDNFPGSFKENSMTS